MRYTTKTLSLIFIFSSFFFTSYAQDYNLEAAKIHLQNEHKKYNLSPEDLDDMTVSSAYISPTTGWYHAYFNQTYQGIEVYNGVLNVALKDGHLLHVASSFVPAMSVQLSGVATARNIDAKTAILKTLESLKIQQSKLEDITQISTSTNSKGEVVKYTFRDKNISDEAIEAKLYWYQYQANVEGTQKPKMALAWNVTFLTKDKQNAWNVQVDVNSGNILSTIDNVIKCNFGHNHRHDKNFEQCQNLSISKEKKKENAKVLVPNSYNVFDYPLESPNHGSRSIVNSPYTKFTPSGTGPGSTNGWHEDGVTAFTDTRGNNVYAQDDTNGDDAGGSRPNPSSYDFDYPYTLGLNTAAANQNAAITNLFYWNNLIHDVLWRMGFDEPAGNFQSNNLGRGGSGNDFVYADAQDGSGTDNANFYTPADGFNPRMQMYLWFSPTSYDADSDFDNAIIAHEYGHGWSIRLTGGPLNVTCLQNVEQGGEGWSDYLGLMLGTNWASLTPTITSASIPRGIGTYVLGQTTSGAGIRPYPYSYNMAINSPVTYAAVANTSFSQPHGIGSIWCTMLWDMTWEIIMQDNAIEPNVFNTSNMIGNVAALKLVNEGLRIQPCSPSFVQARDAILAADQALFAGRYRCAIGRAFARRGLGLNASTGSSSNDRIITADYTPITGNALSSPTSANTCSGYLFEYTATSSTAGTTFSWTRAAVAGIANPASSGSSANVSETLINTTSSPITVTYLFTLLPNTCSLPQSFQVLVNPVITPTVASYNVCQNSSVPSGQGLAMPPTTTINPISDALVVGPAFTRPSGGATLAHYYKVYTYVATTTASVNFELTAGNFDTYLHLYQNSFDPANPLTNLLVSDDDSGVGALSLITYNVVAGTTYYIVVTSYGTLVTGTYTLNASAGGFGVLYNWYTTPTGGTSIFTGSVFNPVGVAGSGIANTLVPVVKSYYVTRSDNPTCRTTTTFTVTSASIDPTISGAVTQSDTICAIFNGGILTVSGHTGTVLGWEASEDDFKTWATTASSSTNYIYNGLVKSRKVRAILDRGGCLIARSKPALLNIISPLQNLTDSVKIDTVLLQSSLSIASQQKIDDKSKVHYMAGRKIELNQGFESKNGSIFKAEIFTNDCFIPAVLTLQPDAIQGKDTDISSLFINNSYPNSQYIVPYNWHQLGNTETRRSLIQFNLSLLPTNAVIDSAFLYLYYSQKFVNDTPPFTGHFGTNSLEIRRILQNWEANTVNWNNQPFTTTTNMVTLPATTSQTQDFSKINVGAMVLDQFTQGNYGFMLKHVSETPYKIHSLTSSEELNSSKRPKLVVYYRYK